MSLPPSPNLRTLVFLLVLLLTSCAPGSGPGTAHHLIIATATPGGTYYPVGVAIGTLVSRKLAPEITASAINSAGSGENIQMLLNNEAQLAILQGLYGAMAYRGSGSYSGKAVRDFRSISMLWQNVEHFLVRRKGSGPTNLSALRDLGKKFSVGKRGSGTEGSTRVILAALDIDPEVDIVCEYLGYTPSALAMMDGRIAGASLPAGPPVAAVTQVFAQIGAARVRILSVSNAQLSAIREVYPVWERYTIAAGTYPGQTDPVETIAQPNFLACRADLPDDVVYQITRGIYENLKGIQNYHSATRAMSLDRSIRGLAVPLHPGAIRYYREKGLRIPSVLIAE